ncbi:MAG: DUF4331 family protein [Myxococcota bacterium]
MRRIHPRTPPLFASLLGASLLVPGCFTEQPMPTDAMEDAMEDAMDDAMDDAVAEDDQGDDPLPGGTAGTTGTTDTTGTTGTTGEDPGETDDPTGEPPDYAFDPSPPEDFMPVDRVGMPAINSAVISDKDLYNTSTPADDAAGTFVAQIVDNLTGLHAALDDDLMAAGLVPCEVGVCVSQAAPLVVPDTLKITLSNAPGFPNGRLPADPVMDVTLAVVLLDLTVADQNPLSLVGLNPRANDREFSDEFPHFAAPHR